METIVKDNLTEINIAKPSNLFSKNSREIQMCTYPYVQK